MIWHNHDTVYQLQSAHNSDHVKFISRASGSNLEARKITMFNIGHAVTL